MEVLHLDEVIVQITGCAVSTDAFNNSISKFQEILKKNNDSTIKNILEVIYQLVQGKESTTKEKYFSLRLLRELMKMRNSKFVHSMLQHKLWGFLRMVAHSITNPSKLSELFNHTNDEFTLCLPKLILFCFSEWNAMYGFDRQQQKTIFNDAFMQISKDNVEFPTNLPVISVPGCAVNKLNAVGKNITMNSISSNSHLPPTLSPLNQNTKLENHNTGSVLQQNYFSNEKDKSSKENLTKNIAQKKNLIFGETQKPDAVSRPPRIEISADAGNTGNLQSRSDSANRGRGFSPLFENQCDDSKISGKKSHNTSKILNMTQKEPIAFENNEKNQPKIVADQSNKQSLKSGGATPKILNLEAQLFGGEPKNLEGPNFNKVLDNTRNSEHNMSRISDNNVSRMGSSNRMPTPPPGDRKGSQPLITIQDSSKEIYLLKEQVEKLKHYESKYKNLEKLVQDLKNDCKTKDEEIFSLTKQIEEKQNEISSEVMKTCENKENEILQIKKNSQEQIIRLQKEIVTMRQAAEESIKKSEELYKENIALKQECTKKLDDHNKESSAIKHEYTKKIEELAKENHYLKQDYTKKLEELQKENNTLKHEFARKTEAVLKENAQTKHEHLLKIDELTKENARIKQEYSRELDTFAKDNNMIKDTYVKKIDELMEENSNLKNDKNQTINYKLEFEKRVTIEAKSREEQENRFKKEKEEYIKKLKQTTQETIMKIGAESDERLKKMSLENEVIVKKLNEQHVQEKQIIEQKLKENLKFFLEEKKNLIERVNSVEGTNFSLKKEIEKLNSIIIENEKSLQAHPHAHTQNNNVLIQKPINNNDKAQSQSQSTKLSFNQSSSHSSGSENHNGSFEGQYSSNKSQQNDVVAVGQQGIPKEMKPDNTQENSINFLITSPQKFPATGRPPARIFHDSPKENFNFNFLEPLASDKLKESSLKNSPKKSPKNNAPFEFEEKRQVSVNSARNKQEEFGANISFDHEPKPICAYYLDNDESHDSDNENEIQQKQFLNIQHDYETFHSKNNENKNLFCSNNSQENLHTKVVQKNNNFLNEAAPITNSKNYGVNLPPAYEGKPATEFTSFNSLKNSGSNSPPSNDNANFKKPHNTNDAKFCSGQSKSINDSKSFDNHQFFNESAIQEVKATINKAPISVMGNEFAKKKNCNEHEPSFLQAISTKNTKQNVDLSSSIKKNKKDPYNYFQFETPVANNSFADDFDMEYEIGEILKPINIGDLPSKVVEYNEEFFLNLGFGDAPQELKFKKSNLKQKSTVYRDENLEIACISSIFCNFSSQKNFLNITYFYSNISRDHITDFTIQFVGDQTISLLVKPEKMEEVIEYQKTLKQGTILEFLCIPYSYILMQGSYSFPHEKDIPFGFYVPMLLTKFMHFGDALLSRDAFEEKWKQVAASNGIEIKSPNFLLNKRIIVDAYDFKKYFAVTILNEEDEFLHVENKKSLFLGGSFEIETPGNEYVLKIEVKPCKRDGTREVIFSIATDEAHENVGEMLIQTLIYIFKQ